MPRVIGITGNIACGKTAVGQMLLALGAERYIDADVVVHRLYEPGQAIALRVEEAFGSSMMAADGSVNRKALGSLVFANADALQCLEDIVHPVVGQALLAELASVSLAGIVVIDAVKLLEGTSGALCQSKWLVICSEEQELARLMERNQMSKADAWARLRAQPDVEPKKALIDEIIDNQGTLAETQLQVAAAFTRFCQKFAM